MSHFEPKSGMSIMPPGKLDHVTDVELLLELRVRKLLGRAEGWASAPDRYVQEGLPLEYQIQEAWKHAADLAARSQLASGIKPFGFKVETVQGDGIFSSPYERHRIVSVPLNYIVDTIAAEVAYSATNTDGAKA